MFFKFSVTRTKKTHSSSLWLRLGSCSPSRVVCRAAVMVATALLPAVASATPMLPDPIYDIVLEENAIQQKIAGPAIYSFGNLSGVVAGSFPNAVATGRAVGGGDISNSANASVFYSYAV